MSVTTYTHHLHGYLGEGSALARRPGLLARVLAALHRSRQLQAAREIERHRDLIAAYSRIGESKGTC